MASLNNSLSYETHRICENLDFQKFSTCSQYLIIIENDGFDQIKNRLSNCTLELVKYNESKSFIKYIYLGIVVVFLGVIVSKALTVFYTKYRIIK